MAMTLTLPQERAAPEFDIRSLILRDLSDSRYLELPFGKSIELPSFPPVRLGPVTLDFSITKHVVFMALAALLTAVLLVVVAREAKRRHGQGANHGPRGVANVIEASILYLRDEVALPNIGPGGERFVPYVVTVFFFILFANLLGLFPWGSSPTGNISVTAALAAMTFVCVEAAGMRAAGARGWLKTVFHIPEGLPAALKPVLLAIMVPVELLGKLAKPFALAIRLYANMTAGHAVALAFAGLLVLAAMAGRLVVTPAPLVMAVAIMVLEVFVAFLQAYIFALLSSVFIGLIRRPHPDGSSSHG